MKSISYTDRRKRIAKQIGYIFGLKEKAAIDLIFELTFMMAKCKEAGLDIEVIFPEKRLSLFKDIDKTHAAIHKSWLEVAIKDENENRFMPSIEGETEVKKELIK